MKLKARISVLSFAALFLAQCSSQALAQGKGKGNGGPPVAPSPTYLVVELLGNPVEYSKGFFFQTYANSLNETAGGKVQVVGRSLSGSALNADYQWVPFLWTVNSDGSYLETDLDMPPGALDADATDINNLGMITINRDQTVPLSAWISVPGLPLQQLPGSIDSKAVAVNDAGQIVGGRYNNYGLFWELDETLSPGLVTKDYGFLPHDIAETGRMVGQDGFAGPVAIAEFVAGSLQVQYLENPDIPFPEFYLYGTATAISPNGNWVVGSAATQGTTHAFRWSQDTGVQFLGTLGGDESEALGVNDSGQVVGWSETGDAKKPEAAFLWDGGFMQDLNDVSHGSGKFQLVQATEINNAGYVTGDMVVSVKGGDEDIAFVLIPPPVE